jgi:hypothetical protein
MGLNDVYILLTSYLHLTFDHLSDRTVDMMLIYIVTHALESRAAVGFVPKDKNDFAAHQSVPRRGGGARLPRTCQSRSCDA